ncbi:MAG: hypothetical protein VX527_10430, partial [Planctomycetota bacterium]|nr:hypothetical protein [Planctomycetota bacterium]
SYASQHGKYKVDDNARDRAISEARRKYPAANRASEAVVIYDLSPSSDEAVRPSDSTGEPQVLNGSGDAKDDQS